MSLRRIMWPDFLPPLQRTLLRISIKERRARPADAIASSSANQFPGMRPRGFFPGADSSLCGHLTMRLPRAKSIPLNQPITSRAGHGDIADLILLAELK